MPRASEHPIPPPPSRGTAVKLIVAESDAIAPCFRSYFGSVSRDGGVNSVMSVDTAVYATVVLTLPVAMELRQDLMATATATDP